jgi:molybdopterin molybdotransferase
VAWRESGNAGNDSGVADLLDIDRAREIVLAEIVPLGSERVPLAEAAGRVLASDAASGEDVPGFDNSAMDGYAVRREDTAGAGERPVRLRVAGESRAGSPADRGLGSGEAIAISTGAMVPDGADAVVRVEDTERAQGGEEVAIHAEADDGQNIRRAGEDIAAGTMVIERGTPIGAAEAGVLASVGIAEPEVFRRPRVAVVATGDELRAPDEPLGPGEIRNSNSYSLPELARRCGASVELRTKVADSLDATREALERALRAELTVVCGGVSVGEHDHVRAALTDLGVEERFWRIALKPGKPTYFGRGPEGNLVLGVPGNPVSAMVTFILFGRPALLAMQGRDPDLTRVRARLASDYEKARDRTEAARCSLRADEQGWVANLATHQGSHVLTSMLGADGLAILPRDARRVEAGETVDVELFDEAI